VLRATRNVLIAEDIILYNGFAVWIFHTAHFAFSEYGGHTILLSLQTNSS